MEENPFQYRTTVEMLDEINKVEEFGASPLSEAVAKAASKLSEDLTQRMAEVSRLKLLRAGYQGSKAAQDARRRLENPKLRTPYAADRAKALLAERLKVVDDINRMATKMFEPLIRLELIDAELVAVRLTLEETLAARETHRETGLYAGTADFVSRMYSRFRIDWRDFDALKEDDEREIAEVIRRRVKPTSGSDENA